MNHRPLLIAHRGARREAPENTIPAFERAIELGADGVELDAMLTLDRQAIVAHNDDLSILTGVKGRMRSTALARAKELDAGSHFSVRFAGTRMPTLAEVLDLVAGRDVLTIMEIKKQPGLEALAARIIGGAIARQRMRGDVVVSSFSPKVLREMARLHPSIPRALIVRGGIYPLLPKALFDRVAPVSAVHLCLPRWHRRLIERLRSRSLGLFAWTANEPGDLDRAWGLGADGIITDDIAFALRHFGRVDARERARATGV